jgi:hypothetical protein
MTGSAPAAFAGRVTIGRQIQRSSLARMMKLARHDIVREPMDDLYDRLISFVAERSKTFSLTLIDVARKNTHALFILESLAPHLVRSEETREWPGTELMKGYSALLHTYRVAPPALATLRKSTRRLYEWQAPNFPDDLCFYRPDGTWVLTTTAHEGEADLHLTDSEHKEVQAELPELALRRHRSRSN